MSVSASAKKRNVSSGQTLIVGVGNPLLGDEGVGWHIVENLSQMVMPDDVRILDCGCDLLNLASCIDKPRRIIVVDAIRAGGKPGQIHTFNLDELDAIQTQKASAHQLQIVDTLRLLKQTYPCLACCKITVMGIEPGALELSTELSEEVNKSIANLTRLVLEEISLQSVVGQGAKPQLTDPKVEASINLVT
jgi:hydrogenase maturation protease